MTSFSNGYNRGKKGPGEILWDPFHMNNYWTEVKSSLNPVNYTLPGILFGQFKPRLDHFIIIDVASSGLVSLFSPFLCLADTVLWFTTIGSWNRSRLRVQTGRTTFKLLVGFREIVKYTRFRSTSRHTVVVKGPRLRSTDNYTIRQKFGLSTSLFLLTRLY